MLQLRPYLVQPNKKQTKYIWHQVAVRTKGTEKVAYSVRERRATGMLLNGTVREASPVMAERPGETLGLV